MYSKDEQRVFRNASKEEIEMVPLYYNPDDETKDKILAKLDKLREELGLVDPEPDLPILTDDEWLERINKTINEPGKDIKTLYEGIDD